MLLRLCCQTLSNRPYLEKILNSRGVRKILTVSGINGNQMLVLVLLYEYLLGQGLSNIRNPLFKRSILAFEREIKDQVIYT